MSKTCNYKLLLLSVLIFFNIPKAIGKIQLDFCWWNQGNVSFWFGPQKYILSAALYIYWWRCIYWCTKLCKKVLINKKLLKYFHLNKLQNNHVQLNYFWKRTNAVLKWLIYQQPWLWMIACSWLQDSYDYNMSPYSWHASHHIFIFSM